ncbi:MAG: 3'-5' exonuclease [Solirubrobacterales bacterium]
MDSFVAIDFETARWGSACAIGVAHFEDGVKIDQRYTLINPQIAARSWDYGAIRIHGIRPDDVAGSPTFADIWPELIHYAACYPLIAHNANFDIGVLRAELARANLASPTIRYGCSMQLARSAWPKRRRTGIEEATVAELRAAPENHGLSTLSEFLDIELDHHNALSDAVACGEITVRAVEKLGENTLAAAYERPRLTWGEMVPEPVASGPSPV